MYPWSVTVRLLSSNILIRQWMQHLVQDWMELLRRGPAPFLRPTSNLPTQLLLEDILLDHQAHYTPVSWAILWHFPGGQGSDVIIWIPSTLWHLFSHMLSWFERNRNCHCPLRTSHNQELADERPKDGFSQDVPIYWPSLESYLKNLAGFFSGGLILNSSTKLSIFQ